MTRSMPRAAFVALLALLALLALSGCQYADKPVAKVGNRIFTVEDFMRSARGNELQFSAVPEEAKKQFLGDLIKTELLVQAARSRGADTTKAAREYQRSVGERIALQTFYERIAPLDAGVSEAETREMWSWQRELSDAQLIYTPDASVARAALEAVQGGRPFMEVANQYNIPGALPNGGALGFIAPGSLIPPLDDALRTQKIGVTSGPFRTPQGWFLLRVNARRSAELPAFETQATAITERIRGRKRMQALSAALDGLEHTYHGNVPEGAAQTIFRFMSAFRVEGLTPWEPTAAERGQALATWDGGQYTLGEAIEDLRNPALQKPAANATPAIASWLHGMLRSRLALVEVRRRHITEEPQVQHQIDVEMSKYLAEGEFNAAIAGVPAPDPAAARAMWDQIKANYPQLDRARVQYLALPDSGMLAAIARHGGHGGGTLKDAVQMAGAPFAVREDVVPFPNPDPQWMSLQPQLMRMAPGEWSGPQPIQGGWLLLQLIDKSQGPRNYEQLSPDMQQNVLNNAWQMARNARFEVFADSLRNVFKPTTVDENVAGLPWPMPAAIDVSR